jgi:DNA primase
VATFGDSVNPSQLRLLRRFQGGVYLWPDNDKAGVKFKKLVGQELLRYVPVYSIPFVPIEKGDPGDLAPDTEAVDSYLSRAELLDLPST